MATVSEMTLDSMMLQIRKVMAMEKQRTAAETSLDIKIKKELGGGR